MFKQLKIYYILISLPFVMMLVGATIFFDAIRMTVLRNPHPQINYTIFVIILCGGIFILVNAGRLLREAKILVLFSDAIRSKPDSTSLKEMTNRFSGDLACLLQMVATMLDRSISNQEQRALEHELENARGHLNRRNALPQYLTGLLVGMGLVGTFIGLLATLNDISVLISSFGDIDMANANPIEVFRVMIERMKAPMRSMGIAFSASLFGLLGSIILGLMMVGIRRLEGDIYSSLSSEVARHIENALSFENLSLRSVDAPAGKAAVSDVSTEILLRIDERLAEAARTRQRSLSSEIDDFKKQRSDMLQVIAEQTEASNNFRGELQQFGSQLGAITNILEKGYGEVSSQISDLVVGMASDAKKTHELQTVQVNEQKRLIDTLGSFKIEERLTEATRMQQRVLSTEMEDFKKQRSDMLQVIAEQTEASNNFRGELQQFGSQLGAVISALEKGTGEISSQISELTVHTTADAKQFRILLNNVGSNLRGALLQVNDSIKTVEERSRELGGQISVLKDNVAADAKGSHEQRENMLQYLTGQVEANNNFRSDMQQVNDSIKTVGERSRELGGLMSALKDNVAADAKGSQEQRENMLQHLMGQVEANNSLRGDLQQLGNQLGAIFEIIETGKDKLSSQIIDLMVNMDSDAKETHKFLAMLLGAKKVTNDAGEIAKESGSRSQV